MIFGTGFAPFRGGPLHYRRTQEAGAAAASGVSGEGSPQAIMAEQGMRRVAVLGGSRIPFCRSHTAYAELSNLDMLTAALGGLIDRFSLHGAHIDEVVGGAVVTHAKDWNLAREAVIGSALAPTTPGITMMQACGTSLQARSASAPRSPPARSNAASRSAPTPRAMRRSCSSGNSPSAWCSSRGRGASARSSRPSRASPRPSLPPSRPPPPSRAPGSAWASIAS